MKCIIENKDKNIDNNKDNNKDNNIDNNIDNNRSDWLYYIYRYNICIMCFNLIKNYCQKK